MRPRLHATALCTLLVLFGATSGRAQSCVNPQSFAAELQGFLEGLHEAESWVESRVPATGALFRASVLDFEAGIVRATPAQLDAICGLFQAYPEIATAPRLLIEQLSRLPSRDESGASGFCPTLTWSQLEAILITTEVLETIALALEIACSNTQCFQLVCGVPCTFAAIAQGLVIPLETVLAENSYCSADRHDVQIRAFFGGAGEALDALQDGLDQAGTFLDREVSDLAKAAGPNSLQSLQQVTTAGFSSLDSRHDGIRADLTSLEATLDDLEEAAIRSHIEGDLQAGVLGRIALLEFPRSLGGLLDEVREVVAATIQAHQAAGQDVDDALDGFHDADQQFNQGAYKAAFRLYREAYRLAVGGSPTPHSSIVERQGGAR